MSIEKFYGDFLRRVMYHVNPVKKKMIKTYCLVHQYLNIEAVELLRVNGFEEEYNFYNKCILELNAGAIWADQDFKSSNHFYHVNKGTGLYGFSNSLSECKKYYTLSKNYYEAGDVNKSMFYLGVVCHLVQDSTVPQHADNKLLSKHRHFEKWIIKRVVNNYYNLNDAKIIRRKNIDEYIRNNALLARNTCLEFKDLKDRDERYDKISRIILLEAEQTTSGILLDFYLSILK